MTAACIQQAGMANAPSLDGAQHKSAMADGEFKVQNICCVGAGYVGKYSTACFMPSLGLGYKDSEKLMVS
jgi:hypothetical protein